MSNFFDNILFEPDIYDMNGHNLILYNYIQNNPQQKNYIENVVEQYLTKILYNNMSYD